MVLSQEFTQRLRQQYNDLPYPANPIEEAPQQNLNYQFTHNYGNPYYLRYRRLPDANHFTILDVGCGSGYTAILLAAANPQAEVIGIDLSETAIEIGKQRANYHGFADRIRFQALSLEHISTLNLEFDYINCDEVLYLLDDQVNALQLMKSVLKPEGIIRANLHSRYNREHYYRAQEFCQRIGLFDDVPGEFEMGILIETMQALKPNTYLRRETWKEPWQQQTIQELTPIQKDLLMMNFFLQNDKGFTISQVFDYLEQSDLVMVEMVDWVSWNLRSLFQDPKNLPSIWEMSLPNLSTPEYLHLYELLDPSHRLLDFWCGHPDATEGSTVGDRPDFEHWSEADWMGATIHLHPQLQDERVKAAVRDAVMQQGAIDLSVFLNHTLPRGASFIVDSALLSASVVPLLDQPQLVDDLVKRWQKIQPINPVTLESVTQTEAFEQIMIFLRQLSSAMYVLVTS